MSNYLTDAQVAQLLRPINGKRVLSRDGMSYVEAYDDKAHLNRIFGFCRFDSELVEQVLLFEEPVKTKNGKDAWSVGYRSVVRLTVKAPDGTPLAVYTEGHAGSSVHPDRGEAHGNAITNSESYALKRCATFLGDQFGLSLYNKGSQAALVRDTLVKPGEATAGADVQEGLPQVQPESEQAEPAAPAGETNTPEPPDPGEQERQAKADALRDQIIAATDGKALRDLAPQMRGVQTEVVGDADGKPVVLAALLKRRLAELSGVAA